MSPAGKDDHLATGEVVALAGRGRSLIALVLEVALPALVLASGIDRGSTWQVGLGIGLFVLVGARWYRDGRKQVPTSVAVGHDGLTIFRAAGGAPSTWAWAEIERVQRRAPKEVVITPRSGDPVEVPLARRADTGPALEEVADLIVACAIAGGAVDSPNVLPRFLPDAAEGPAAP